MKIGVDATVWWNRRGFGRMARELLTALFELNSEHQFYLFIDQDADPAMLRDNINLIPVFPERPVTAAAVANDSRSISDMLRFYKAVANSPIDLMFFPAVYSWFPVPKRLPTVVTLHDAIAEHFPDLIFPHWKGRLFWRLKVKLALWQANRVMTVSHAAKSEIEQYIGVKGQIIDVISEAPNALFQKKTDTDACLALRDRLGIPKDARLIVYVGGLAPHKNLSGFIEGFVNAKASGSIDDVHIVLVGDYAGAGFHSNYEELNALVERHQLMSSVHFTGFISDEELVLLYNDALAAAMPSFSEGFGLPAVEAMACGTPVLSSNQGSLPEVVGQGGIYFSPYDIESIAAAIIEIANDNKKYDRLVKQAYSRAQTFTWEKAAKLALGYLEAVHSEGK